MPGRILNFSEFFGKYSTDQGDKGATGFEDFAKASTNFETGFDETSYDKTQLGPNRPIKGVEGAVPAPGETGAPVFKSAKPQGMESPEEFETEEPEEFEEGEEYEEEAPEAEESEELEDEEEEEFEESEEEEEADETPEPEMGANPRMKKKTNEQYYPNFDISTEFSDEDEEEELEDEEMDFGMNPRFASAFNDFESDLEDWDDSSWEEESDENCLSCGEFGMQCGCNM